MASRWLSLSMSIFSKARSHMNLADKTKDSQTTALALFRISSAGVLLCDEGFVSCRAVVLVGLRGGGASCSGPGGIAGSRGR